MPFDSNLPKSLKIVYGINIFFVSLLIIAGFLVAQGFAFFYAVTILFFAYLYWHFLTKALVQKKRYSYWLNLFIHALTIVMFVIGAFKNGVVWLDFIRVLDVAVIYLLLRPEVRAIFIKSSPSSF